MKLIHAYTTSAAALELRIAKAELDAAIQARRDNPMSEEAYKASLEAHNNYLEAKAILARFQAS